MMKLVFSTTLFVLRTGGTAPGPEPSVPLVRPSLLGTARALFSASSEKGHPRGRSSCEDDPKVGGQPAPHHDKPILADVESSSFSFLDPHRTASGPRF